MNKIEITRGYEGYNDKVTPWTNPVVRNGFRQPRTSKHQNQDRQRVKRKK